MKEINLVEQVFQFKLLNYPTKRIYLKIFFLILYLKILFQVCCCWCQLHCKQHKFQILNYKKSFFMQLDPFHNESHLNFWDHIFSSRETKNQIYNLIFIWKQSFHHNYRHNILKNRLVFVRHQKHNHFYLFSDNLQLDTI